MQVAEDRGRAAGSGNGGSNFSSRERPGSH